MSIILKRGRYLSGRKLYGPGDLLPDTARALVDRGDAEIVEEPATPVQKTAKPAKTKPAPEPNPVTQESDNEDGTDNP